MSIGRELLDVPFAEMVRNLAVAIADGQTALDRNSIETLRMLADTPVQIITDVTDVIESNEFDVDTSTGKVHVTGARVVSSGSAPIAMTMLQAGVSPTFYQFTEATIEVRMSITIRDQSDDRSQSQSNFLGMGGSRAYASSINFRHANQYNYAATGSSFMKVVMRPVPPPTRLEPTTTTVNMLTTPPTVTRSAL